MAEAGGVSTGVLLGAAVTALTPSKGFSSCGAAAVLCTVVLCAVGLLAVAPSAVAPAVCCVFIAVLCCAVLWSIACTGG